VPCPSQGSSPRAYIGIEVLRHHAYRTVGEFLNGGAVASSPAVVDGVVYLGDWNGRIWALYARTGKVKWSFKTNGKIKGGVAVSGDTWIDLVPLIGERPPAFEVRWLDGTTITQVSQVTMQAIRNGSPVRNDWRCSSSTRSRSSSGQT
jgi:outer membrane protein assembly factor BamB